MYNIPNAEMQRIHALKEYTIIESANSTIIPNGDIFKSIITYQKITSSLLEWSCYQKAGKNYTTISLSIPEINEQLGSDITYKNGNRDNVHYAKLYKIQIDQPINEQNDHEIINTTINAIIQQQSPKHFTQFLVGCAAVQHIISPQPNTQPPYIAISPKNPQKNKPFTIHTTHARKDIISATMPLPNESIIHSANNLTVTKYLHELHTHDLTHEGMSILNDILGPWQHPMLEENIDADQYSWNERLYHPRIRCTTWQESQNFMPPNWYGCPDIRQIEQDSQHTWMKRQRAIQAAVNQLTPYITPKNSND